MIGALDKLILQMPELKLIVIDTLQMIRGVSNGRENEYARDYKEMRILKEFADRHKLCVLAIHHTRKTADESDPLIAFLVVSASRAWLIQLWSWSESNAWPTRRASPLRGRDIVSEEYTLRFDRDQCKWEMVGNAADLDAKFAKNQYESDEIVQAIREAVALGQGTWRGTMSALNGVAQDTKHIGHVLCPPRALASMIVKIEDALYRYDGISHSVVQNGTGGRQHIFTQATAQGLDKWSKYRVTARLMIQTEALP